MASLDPKQQEFSNALEGSDAIIVAVPSSTVVVNRPRKVYAGMWGPPEIGAVSAGVLAVLMAAVAYFFWVVPSNNELVKNKAEADRLESELISAKAKYGEITNTETQVAKIVESIGDFEARFLPVTATGQSALYQRLNGLIAAYGLSNTSGPDYVPLEINEANGGDQTQEEKGRSKYRSLYPGVYATMTLEGSYQNLRRFIREIETGREFIIVSSVELAPSEKGKGSDQSRPESNPAQNPATDSSMAPAPGFGDPRGFPGPSRSTAPQSSARQQGKTYGEAVSLRIELAAYFRRPGMSPATAIQ